MAITLRDVARASGVSVSVVSRSFLDGSPVAAGTRARVLEAARKLGYQRNKLAAGLTTGHTRLVALVLDDGSDGPTLDLAWAVSRGLQAEGLRPLLIHVGGPREGREALRAMREYAVEAAVVLSPALPFAFVRALGEDGVPVIHAQARLTGAPEGSQVALAESLAGREAARLLSARGYARLAVIGGPELLQPSRDRVAGFRAMASKLGGEPRMAFAPRLDPESGRAAMARLLADGPLDAVFCADDRLAVGAVAAAREAGLAVPEELGVLGCGGHEAAGWAGVEITTLAAPAAEVAGATVAMTLDALAHRGRSPEPRRFDLSLVERGTLRALPRRAVAS